MITDEQTAQLMATFGEAMMQVEPDAAQALMRDAFGIDPEVYEWDQGEILKAIFKKIGGLDEGGLNRLLAKMAVAGGRKACEVVAVVFAAQAEEAGSATYEGSGTRIAADAPERPPMPRMEDCEGILLMPLERIAKARREGTYGVLPPPTVPGTSDTE